MSELIIDPSFWALFPESEIGVVVLREIDNSASRPEIVSGLATANETAKKWLTDPVLSQCPAVSVWRQAYSKFKTKKGVRSSIEAMLRRIDKGKGVGPINPMVDLYNTISLTYGFPCGAEDIDSFAGNLRLTVTSGGDDFLALGEEENDPTLPGEVCYLDDQGAVCRCWNWRDGQRTMVTENSRNVIVVMEYMDGTRHNDMVQAMEELTHAARESLGATVAAQVILTQTAPSVSLH